MVTTRQEAMYLKRIESILQVPNIDEKPCIAQMNFAEETMKAIYLEFNFTCTALVKAKMKPTETAEYWNMAVVVSCACFSSQGTNCCHIWSVYFASYVS